MCKKIYLLICHLFCHMEIKQTSLSRYHFQFHFQFSKQFTVFYAKKMRIKTLLREAYSYFFHKLCRYVKQFFSQTRIRYNRLSSNKIRCFSRHPFRPKSLYASGVQERTGFHLLQNPLIPQSIPISNLYILLKKNVLPSR